MEGEINLPRSKIRFFLITSAVLPYILSSHSIRRIEKLTLWHIRTRPNEATSVLGAKKVMLFSVNPRGASRCGGERHTYSPLAKRSVT